MIAQIAQAIGQNAAYRPAWSTFYCYEEFEDKMSCMLDNDLDRFRFCMQSSLRLNPNTRPVCNLIGSYPILSGLSLSTQQFNIVHQRTDGKDRFCLSDI